MPVGWPHRFAARPRSTFARRPRPRCSGFATRFPPEDRMLLVLRLDREMSWTEVARVLTDDAADADVSREAARLRKRFERVKAKLAEQLRGLAEDA